MKIPYDWGCKNCNKSNPAHQELCVYCGCPAELSSQDLESFKLNGFVTRKPQIVISAGMIVGLSNCPKCFQLMYVKHKVCPHCHYELTSREHENQLKRYKHNFVKGIKVAVATFSILFILVFLIYGG